jgi:hypothetical protein
VNAGDRVCLPDGRAGQIIGWQGERPIVALDNGTLVTVALPELRRLR